MDPSLADPTTPEPDHPAPSRRGLLRLAGAAAAGAVVAATASRGSVDAASGAPLLIGQGNFPTNASDLTLLVGTFQALADSRNVTAAYSSHGGTIVGFDTAGPDANNLRGGVLGVCHVAGDVSNANGVIGFQANSSGTGAGVVAHSESTIPGASAGLRAKSTAGPAVQLDPTLAGPPSSGTWTLGAIVPDTAGALWYCTKSGTPGTWRNLASGGYVALTPGRIYDSRGMGGPLTQGGTRDLTIRDRIDPSTFLVNLANFVPTGATSVTANVTVVNTFSAGFLAINPKGDTTVHAATVNWSESGQILNNGVTFTLGGDREVVVIAGGSGGAKTDFVIDVTGYFL